MVPDHPAPAHRDLPLGLLQVTPAQRCARPLPKDYAYIIDELLHPTMMRADKRDYYENIINTIIDLGQADRFIEGGLSGD